MDATPWPQGLQDIKLGKPMEEVVTNNNICTARPILEKKARPQEQLNCPRCNSTNTKFCYYNNYSLTQPRYFCKTCRRYWTEGGSLRNVPVGGGSRKNKKSSSILSSTPTTSSSSSSASSPKLNLPDLNPPSLSQFSSHSQQNPNKTHQGQDLNLGFPLAIQEDSAQALELLRTGISSRGLNSYIPMPMPESNTLYSSGFPLQELKPALSFSVDGTGSRYGVQENGGRILFPFGDMKPIPNTSSDVDHQRKAQGSSTSTPSGYWTGMLGGGGSW